MDHAHRSGAVTVEGYPVDTAAAARPASGLYTGTLTLFLRAGFEEVARRTPARPIVQRSALS